MYSARYCAVLFGSIDKKGYAKIKPSTPKNKKYGHRRRRNGSLTQINREESCTPVSSDTPAQLANDHNKKRTNKLGKAKLYYGPIRNGLTL